MDAEGPGCCSQLAAAFSDQADVLRWMWKTRAIRVPMVVYWAEDIGGAVSAPVIFFFYTQLGLSPTQIGNAGFVSTLGTLIASPLYGTLMDRWSGYGVVLVHRAGSIDSKLSPSGWLQVSVSLCGIGCALKGLATSAEMVYLQLCGVLPLRCVSGAVCCTG